MLKTWTKAWALGKHEHLRKSDFTHFRTQYPILMSREHEWVDAVDFHPCHQRTSVTEALSVLLATSGLRILGPKGQEMTFANVTSDEHLCKGYFPFSFFFSMHWKTWHTIKPPNRTPLLCMSFWNFRNCDEIFPNISFHQTKYVNTSVIVETFAEFGAAYYSMVRAVFSTSILLKTQI